MRKWLMLEFVAGMFCIVGVDNIFDSGNYLNGSIIWALGLILTGVVGHFTYGKVLVTEEDADRIALYDKRAKEALKHLSLPKNLDGIEDLKKAIDEHGER